MLGVEQIVSYVLYVVFVMLFVMLFCGSSQSYACVAQW